MNRYSTPFRNLSSFMDALRSRNAIKEITTEVDPHLEIAEIHRRVIDEQGPALLFRKVKGSHYPVVTNLFGTKERVELAFGLEGPKLIERIAKYPHSLVPPKFGSLLSEKDILWRLAKRTGIKHRLKAPILHSHSTNPNLETLPLLTTWKEDGGPFITLPLVYTQHPTTGASNLGMYRIQRFSPNTTGLHMQIGKGGGFHLAEAAELNQKLPVNIFVGGPPVAILGAIAPLPENVPELILSSFLLNEKVLMAENPFGPLPILGEAEFALIGETIPGETHPEGPFGDHYGYYSLKHDYPVFHCKALCHRKNAVYPATVVGKPRQEDYFIGNYLQELLSPLFPVVMPAVKDLWSYGETGYHSLAAAVVRERYKREAMVSAFRILGEGQLSLTKFLLIINESKDLKDFKAVLEHILQRTDFRTDLFLFSNLSMDTLDYTGPQVNEGSKGVLLGIGDPIRSLPQEFSGHLPAGLRKAIPYCAGCLVVEGASHHDDKSFPNVIAREPAFSSWPLVILVDDAAKATENMQSFLWTTFTRFEPAADIYSKNIRLVRNHPSFDMPLCIDARMKSWYPIELNCDPDTQSLVDRRWKEYFPR